MIKQVFHIKNYWKVIVYYNVDYNFFDIIRKDLVKINASDTTIDDIYYNLVVREAKGATYSNTHKHVSIMLFNHHSSKTDYINTVVHEAEHVKQAMLKVYKVEDKGESPAYTIGYLLSKMYPVVMKIINRLSVF